MPRRPTIRNNIFPYHIVARAHNRQWFPLPIQEMWAIYLELLKKSNQQDNLKINAFVLMNNHFHLLVETPKSNIDRVMYNIMKGSTLTVQKRAKVINSIYGSRYKSSLLTKPDYRLNTLKYILRNPCVANLCKLPQDYPYSTHHYDMFGKTLPFELEKIAYREFFEDKDTFNRWLNLSFTHREAQSIQTGLTRPEFEYAKDDGNRKFIVPKIEHPEIGEMKVLWEKFMPMN